MVIFGEVCLNRVGGSIIPLALFLSSLDGVLIEFLVEDFGMGVMLAVLFIN